MTNERIETIHQAPYKDDKDYVLYWLQHTQRIHENHALARAVDLANQLEKPLKVILVIDEDFIYANDRNLTFMLEGFKALTHDLHALGAMVHVEVGPTEMSLLSCLQDAAALIMDRSYLRPIRRMKERISARAQSIDLPTEIVESDVIVPVQVASDKLETAARTLRPSLQKHVGNFTDAITIPELFIQSAYLHSPFDTPIETLVASMNINHSIAPIPYFKGGEHEALAHMDRFIASTLDEYKNSNDPAKDATSKLSPYLHFGMLAPMRLYRVVRASKVDQDSKDGFLEQLLVRRELAFNFIHFEPCYDDFDHMTHAWAYKTMDIHKHDTRPYHYTLEDYVAANTHDPYFNAAMKEMVHTGHMHNYMRMYWGKKILEWSKDYKTAYATMLYLNNHYFLDGRDPNSYTGVAWCFGRHDHGFKERDVFGKIRYMNQKGLKRKFDIDAYKARMDALEE